MFRRFRLRASRGQEGIALVELTGALTILAIGFLALAAGLGGGFRQIALSRQRQVASEIGNGRVEHLRNVPYAYVAVSSDVTHNTDPSHPDHFVDDATNSFDYSGTGTYEPLIEDPSIGQVEHFESPVVVGATTLTVYQYVTWVDDPAIDGTEDYRRVTVVVQFNRPAAEGAARMVRVSSYFTSGNVTLGGTTPGVATGSPTPSGSASPSPTPSGSCSGDTTAPSGSFEIFGGIASETGFTASRSVTLPFSGVSDPCTPIRWRFSNDDVTYGDDIVYDASNPSVAWALAGADGTKQVWGRLRDGLGNERTVGPRSVVLDTTKPTVPGTLSRTVACAGANRTVNLSWGSSTDTNFRGYRIYKRIDGGAWFELRTVSSTSSSDTDKKSYDSLQYYVVGYDKAGNQSNGTNIVSLAKNQCS
ncbi:MAG TPA: hypothetical protein VM841_11050 [Actinomycetota bacterium]|nr:hypothetical protein [Actinomycetota bacterium]